MEELGKSSFSSYSFLLRKKKKKKYKISDPTIILFFRSARSNNNCTVTLPRALAGAPMLSIFFEFLAEFSTQKKKRPKGSWADLKF